MHHYIGLMSGTSADGIDAALVAIGGAGSVQVVATRQHPYPAELRSAVQELMTPGGGELDRAGSLDMEIGQQFADAALSLIYQAGVDKSAIRAIGSHGQTVRHRPTARSPFTCQLGNPSVIAELTGITTVADFRARDMAAGGQGAPLVPAFHNAVFRNASTNRAILNIGGIANLTYLPANPAGAVTGFDTGPGNTLLDQWTSIHNHCPYDEAGAWASGGKAEESLVERLLSDSYFVAKPPKSTGREHFNLNWLRAQLSGNESPQDVQASLAELTVRSIVQAMQSHLPDKVSELYVCGGGAHNRDLMQRLESSIDGVHVALTSTLGFDPDWIEAIAFGWLAHQALAGHPGNIPSVTGAKRAVTLGGIYLG